MPIYSITAGHLKLTINENPFSLLELSNTRTGKTYCKDGQLLILVRVPSHISDPHIIAYPEKISSDENKLSIYLKDKSGVERAELIISEVEDELYFKLDVNSSEQIWIAEFRSTGFIMDELIIPALGGHSISKEMTIDTILTYKYPFWWNAQFVIGSSGDEGIWFHTKNPKPDFKLFRVKKNEDNFELSLGFEVKAPLGQTNLECDWYIGSYENDWKIPVDKHREWIEKELNLVPASEHKNFPEWANDVNFILEIWGMRKDNPIPNHTFEEMIERITQFSKMHSPLNTLLYLPGFAEHGIDSHAPDYSAAEECGGEEKFLELMDSAHQFGYKVMLHTNVLAMTFNHPLFEKFKEHQVVDVFNRKQGWAMDIDGDWLAEEYFAYINPGVKEWGDLMEEVIGKLINIYKADAVFLDQTLLAFNVVKGPDFLIGMREHIQRLQNAFPHTLFAGEGINEQVLPALPMAQIHGIDGLADVHGIELKNPWKKAHQVSAYFFGKYTRLTAHLLTKYPSHPLFRLQESAYKYLNVIPALCLYERKQQMDIPEVHKMIERAKLLNFKQQNLQNTKV